jgi:hypothetical protein
MITDLTKWAREDGAAIARNAGNIQERVHDWDRARVEGTRGTVTSVYASKVRHGGGREEV